MAAAPGWSRKKTAASVIIAIVVVIVLFGMMGNDLLSPLLGRYEKEIVIRAKYTVPP